LLSSWREREYPWVLTRYHNEPGSQYERLLHWYKVRDYPDTEIVSELDEFVPGALAVVDKTGYTAMTAKVQSVIADLGVTDVVVAGLDTDTCVLKTVADVFEAGLRPWLAADCCASNGGVREHRAGLRLAGRFIGAEQVRPAAEILAALEP
jgi:nicotinamidase-related amidase